MSEEVRPVLLTLRDAEGRPCERAVLPAKEAARRGGAFLLAQAADPESGGLAGSIEFEPAAGESRRGEVRPDAPAGERPVGRVVLRDATGRHPNLTVRVTASASQLFLRPEGYGEPDAEDGSGSPAFLDLHGGVLRLVAFPDVNDPDPLLVPLDGAEESRRRPHVETERVPNKELSHARDRPGRVERC
jgi:hypothetical protein